MKRSYIQRKTPIKRHYPNKGKPTLESTTARSSGISVASRKPKKPKKNTISKLKKKRRQRTERQKLEDAVWELCKKVTRKRYMNEDGTWTCYTTGNNIQEPRDCHTGHGKPKGALKLLYKYDLRNLRPQTYNANINLGGMSDIFIAKLEREKEGLEFLNEACVKIDGRWEIRGDTPTMGSLEAEEFLRGLIEKYKAMLQ